MDLILFGMQGSGKGTLGKALASYFNMNTYETGAVLRKLSNEKSPLGDKIKKILESGNLVDNEIVMETVKDFIKKNSSEKSIIFDGIPRSIEQANSLKDLLSSLNRKFLAFHLEIDEETAMKRLTTRKMCKKCNAIYPADYSKKYCEQKIDGQECKGELFSRSDDNPETIKKRIDIYNEKTIPAINVFKENLIEMDGRPPIEPVKESAIKLLNPILR